MRVRFVAALVCVLGLFPGLAFGNGASIPVEVAEVEKDSGLDPVKAAGTLELRLEIPMSFKVSGVVDGIYVDEGDTVTKGQVLAQLIDTEVDSREQSAAARAAQADSALQRARVLAERGVISQAALESAESEARQARAALDAAKFDSRFGRITAPADGVVLVRRADPGELVNAGVSVLTIGNTDEGFILKVPLSDRDVVRLAPGDDAWVSFATGGPPIRATVTRLAAKAHEATGAFNAELALDVSEQQAKILRSGMIGSATIVPRNQPSDEARVVIPADAIVEANGKQATVYLIDTDNKARFRQVRVAEIRPDRVVVDAGLAIGEKVVVSGAAFLREGRDVSIVPNRADVTTPETVTAE